jgi:hypothetical protein
MLPANPRPTPPAPKTSQQALMEAQTLGLLEGKEAPDMGGTHQDMNAAGMAAGVKTAGVWDLLGRLAMKAVRRPGLLTAGLAAGTTAAGLGAYARHLTGPGVIDEGNGPLASPSTGGYTAPSDMKPGGSWSWPYSVSGSGRTPPTSSSYIEPPSTGRHMLNHLLQDMQPANKALPKGLKIPFGVKTPLDSAEVPWAGEKGGSAPTDGQPKRSATGESVGLAFQHKDDDYAKGQDAWAATGKYFRNKLKAEPDPFKGLHRGKTADTWSDLAAVGGAIPSITTSPGNFAASVGRLTGNAFNRYVRKPPAPVAPTPPAMAGPRPMQKAGGVMDMILRGGAALGRKALPMLGRAIGGAEAGAGAAEGGFGGLLAARRGFGMLKQVGGPGERLIGQATFGAGKGAMLPAAAENFANPATKGFFRMGAGWGATAGGTAPSVARHEIGHGLVEGAQTALGNGMQAPAGTPWLARQAAGMMNSQRSAIRGLGGIANETFAHAAEGRTGLGQVARGANFLFNPDKTLAYRGAIAQQSPLVGNLWAGGTTAGAVGAGGAGVYGAGRMLGKQGGMLDFTARLVSRFGPKLLGHLGRLASGAAEGFGATNRAVGGQMSNLPGFFSPPKLLPLGLAAGAGAAGAGAFAAGAGKQGEDAFAEGFFQACAAKGLTEAEAKAAVEKAAEFAPEAAAELRAGLEKRAGPVDWAATKALPWALKAAPKALGAIRRVAATPGVGAAVAKQVLPTAGGMAAGGWAGTEANLPGNVDTGLGFHVNVPGMVAGGMAMNPYLRKLAPAASQAGRTAFWGSQAGALGDTAARQFGVDTGGWGARLGLAGGLGVGGARAGNAVLPGLVPGSRALSQAARGFKNFTQAGWMAPLRMGSSAANYMTGGGYKVPSMLAKWPGMIPAGRAGLAGGRLAALGMIGTAGGAAMGALRNQGHEEIQRAYEKFRPQVANDAAEFGDAYLKDRIPQVAQMAGQQADQWLGNKAQQLGMVDPGTGQVHPTYALFHALGMDPTKMSAMQRLLMLGGGAAGVGGLATGNPLLTALGGAAGLGGMAMGGARPHMPPMSGWAASQLQPRNEWAAQQAMNQHGG